MSEVSIPNDTSNLDKTTRRRIAKAKKKEKLKREKEEFQKKRLEKKQAIIAKIRAKRQKEQEEASKCWICGENDHVKMNCPNKSNFKKTCFHCRQRGHTANECPQVQGEGKNICFNCGSEGHSLKACKKKKINGGLSFAKCFICNESGHIISQCPKSASGVYPKGGSCRGCGSKMHLARDCPELETTSSHKEKKPHDVPTYNNDDDLGPTSKTPTKSTNAKTGPKNPKIVKF